VGSYGDCGYTTIFDWPGRPEWNLVPPSGRPSQGANRGGPQSLKILEKSLLTFIR